MINGPNLYAYCSNNPVNLIDPWGLWGGGIIISETTEAGVVVTGAGQTGSAGAGIFSQGPGGFVSWGGFIGGPGYNVVGGAYVGVGIGIFGTNASSVSQLSGMSRTYSFNLGIGPKISFQFGRSDNGTWIASATIGLGGIVSGSGYQTNTKTTPSGGPADPGGKNGGCSDGDGEPTNPDNVI